MMMLQLFAHAETSPEHPWRSLRDRSYAASPAEIARLLRDAVASMPRWRYIGYDRGAGVIHLEHDTPLIAFTDDVILHLRADGERTSVTARSRSRVGSFDFGVNMMNLRSILRALDRAVATSRLAGEPAAGDRRTAGSMIP